MKVRLNVEDDSSYLPPHLGHVNITASLPFFNGQLGKYFHRVRYARIHTMEGRYSHTSVTFWCGNSGFLGSKKRQRKNAMLYSEVPQGQIVCATCEGRAIGSGKLGSRMINGSFVKFSPRTKSAEVEK